jgi:hypothetical protein
MAGFTINEGGLQRSDRLSSDRSSPLQERYTGESQRDRTTATRIENLLGSDEEGVLVALSQDAGRQAAKAAQTESILFKEPAPERTSPTYSRSEVTPPTSGGNEILPGALIDILI